MAQPSYHLRANKAVDRFIFIDCLRRHLPEPSQLTGYTYYGLGGPFLEDFKVLHENFPEMRMISIEKRHEVLKRQRFHLPCKGIKLIQSDFTSFLSSFTCDDHKVVFWLDYDNIRYQYFQNFISLLGKLPCQSVVKITLRAEPADYVPDSPVKAVDEFLKQYASVLPAGTTGLPSQQSDFCFFLQKMFEIASKKAFEGSTFSFQPLSSTYYREGVGIFTLTGIVCAEDEEQVIKARYAKWPFATLEWDHKPNYINVPSLSPKERLHLQRFLPSKTKTGTALKRSLGYDIGSTQADTNELMTQYAQFHRLYPQFVRAIP